MYKVSTAMYVGLVWMAVACGVPTESGDQSAVGSTSQPSAPAPTPPSSTTDVPPTNSEVVPATTEAVQPTTSAPPSKESVLEIDDVRVAFVVPDDVIPAELPAPPLLDPVILQDRWLTSCCLLVVSAQREVPLMPEKDRFDTLTVNGSEWHLFEFGPMDGTKIYAFTASDDTAVGVFVSYNLDDEPGETGREVARSFVSTFSVEFGKAG